MGLFTRSSRSGAPAILPVWSPFSSLDYHLELGRQVATELERRKLDHSLGEDAATFEVGGRSERLDLRSLARVLADRPVRDWAGIISSRVDEVVSTGRETAQFVSEARPLAEVTDLLVLRLVPSGGEGTLRPLADGLAAQLVYALPGAVVTVPDEHVRGWDVDPHRLLDDAVAHTRQLVRSLLSAGHERQSRYDVVAQASPFTASTLLCMDEMVGPVTPYGVFVGVPSAYEMVAHVITDAAGASAVMDELPESVRGRHARVPEPLSPTMYWWHSGELVAVPAVDSDDGDLDVRPPEALAGVLAGLPES